MGICENIKEYDEEVIKYGMDMFKTRGRCAYSGRFSDYYRENQEYI